MECNEVRKRRQRITRTRAAACRKPGRPVQFSAERKEAPVCRAVGETKNDALPPMQQKEAGTEAAGTKEQEANPWRRIAGKRRDDRKRTGKGNQEDRAEGEPKNATDLSPDEAGRLMQKIPVYSPDQSYLAEYAEAVIRVLSSGQYTNFGPCEETFRQMLLEYTGIPCCQPVSSGDMALYLALLGMREGEKEQQEAEKPREAEPPGPGRGRREDLCRDSEKKEVITTPFTFPSTTEAILRAGYRPVFADVDPITLTLSPEAVRSRITKNTAGILPVHVYGNLCDTEAIGEIAKEHHLFVVYDAAHAFGETRHGRSILEEGDLTAISTHTTKTLHTVEGGCLFGRDRKVMERIRRMSNFGLSGREGTPVPEIGCNAKMNELEAAIGIVNLSHYDTGREKRARLDARYRERLGGLPGIGLRPLQSGVESNFSYFPVFVTERFGITRDDLRSYLKSHGVSTRRYFYPLVSESDAIRKASGMAPLPEDPGEREKVLMAKTPAAFAASRQVLCLPLYSDLPLEAVDHICALITAVVRSAQSRT